MPTTRSDAPRLRRAGLPALLALSLLLAGCSGDDAPPPAAETEQEGVGAGRTIDAPDVARGVAQALDRRAQAVRAGDRAAFLAGVQHGGFAAQQATYFDNLAALPLGEFGYALDRTSLVRDGGDYWAEVEVTLELDGYDDVPVTTRDRYRFSSTRQGRFVLTSVSDPAWEKRSGVTSQPWDTGPVTVVSRDGVLGIFDGGSAARAGAVMADAGSGVAAVRAEIPYEWDGRVVVYALSDPDFLVGVEGLPGDDPLAIDAVTFPVHARPGSATVSSTRFVLNPRMLATPGPARQRLVRHELTHVALGQRQDGVPTWLSEGLAEYVSVRPIAPDARAISGAALAAAEEGLTALPSDDDFNGPTSEANYGIAWWACEYLARTYDEAMLWVLLDAMVDSRGADGVLKRVVGIGEPKLARQAGQLMLDTYRPEPPKREPKPSRSPSPTEDPTAEPSVDPSGGASSDPSSDPSE